MDKKKSILNVSVSLLSRAILLIMALLVRRILIKYIGNSINGLNSLYSSILNVLSVTELGIGSAIIYSMYKPIVVRDKNRIRALYNLYKKYYIIIGTVIFVGGLALMPILPFFIADFEKISVDVYLSFFLALISVTISYFYGAKTALLEAYKDNYIATIIVTVSSLIRFGLQIIVMIVWKSFLYYLMCQIIGASIAWVVTEIVVRKKYEDIIHTHEALDDTTQTEIRQNIKAMALHKVGDVVVVGIDNLIISGFIGVVTLGLFTNYSYIAGVIMGFASLFFTPLTSIVGHICARDKPEDSKEYFDFFYSLNYILGVVLFLGYFAVINNVVRLCFGNGLEVSRSIVFIITLNQFIVFIRRTALLFRNASGTFYYDRWKPIGEGICNLVLSLLFVQIFPEEYRVVGVIVATIITTLGICHIVDPYVVYKHAFHMPVKEYYIRNYSYIGLFTVALIGLSFLIKESEKPITGIFINGLISLAISLIVLTLVTIFDKSFRNFVFTVIRKVMVRKCSSR